MKPMHTVSTPNNRSKGKLPRKGKSSRVRNKLELVSCPSDIYEELAFDGKPMVMLLGKMPKSKKPRDFPSVIWLYFKDRRLIALAKLGRTSAGAWLYSRHREVWPVGLAFHELSGKIDLALMNIHDDCCIGDATDSCFIRFNSTDYGKEEFWEPLRARRKQIGVKITDKIRRLVEYAPDNLSDKIKALGHFVFHEGAGHWFVVFNNSDPFTVPAGDSARFINHLLKNPRKWLHSEELYRLVSPEPPVTDNANLLGNVNDIESAGIQISRNINKEEKIYNKATVQRLLRIKRQLQANIEMTGISHMEQDELKEELNKISKSLNNALYSYNSSNKRLHDRVRHQIARFRKTLLESNNPACKAFHKHLCDCIPGSDNQHWIYINPDGIQWSD